MVTGYDVDVLFRLRSTVMVVIGRWELRDDGNGSVWSACGCRRGWFWWWSSWGCRVAGQAAARGGNGWWSRWCWPSGHTRSVLDRFGSGGPGQVRVSGQPRSNPVNCWSTSTSVLIERRSGHVLV